jgi:hypothetical protein
MHVDLCDVCGKVIDHGEWGSRKGYTIGRSSSAGFQVCERCGKQLEEFIRKLEKAKKSFAKAA